MVSLTVVAAMASRRKPLLFLAAFALTILFASKENVLSIGHLFGFNILGTDPLLAIAIAGTMLGLPTLRARLEGLQTRVVLLVIMVVIQSIVGYAIYYTAAALAVRPLLTLLGLVAFMLSLKPEHDIRALARIWLYWTAFALCILVFVRGTVSGFGNANEYFLAADGQEISVRVVTAAQIVVVAAAALLSLHESSVRRNGFVVLRTVLFFSTVLVAQHRSVWLAALVGLLVMLVRTLPPRRVLNATLVLVFVLGLAAPALIYTPEGRKITHAISASSSTVSLSTGTGGARVSDNVQLVKRAWGMGPVIVLLGEPYGAPFIRYENGRLVTFQPHDAYTQTFLRQGLVGLLLFLAVLVPLWRRSWSARSRWLGVATLYLVFSTAYAFPVELAPTLAVLFVVPRQSRDVNTDQTYMSQIAGRPAPVAAR